MLTLRQRSSSRYMRRQSAKMMSSYLSLAKNKINFLAPMMVSYFSAHGEVAQYASKIVFLVLFVSLNQRMSFCGLARVSGTVLKFLKK